MKHLCGILTFSLIEGIKGAALREDKFVDINTLFQYARERVPALAGEIGGIQEPKVISPLGAESFDLGELTKEDKEKIPLSTIKPMFIRSNFQDEDEFADVLGLGKAIDQKLIDVSARGTYNYLIFVNTDEFPAAYQLTGRYVQSKDAVTLTMKIKNADLDEKVTLTATDKESLIPLIIREVEKVIPATN